MASLFDGTPQTSTNITTTSSQTPQWMQDAIYRQIQLVQNVGSTPYTPYGGQLTAGLSPLSQQAAQQAQVAQGSWRAPYQNAITGLQGLSSGPNSTGAASGYLNAAAGMNGLSAAQPFLGQQAGQLNNINYSAGSQALSPFVQSALTGNNGLTAAQPYVNQANQTDASDIQDFMNPYNQNVTDEIARLGARNLRENLLPSVSDEFVKSGQFGSTRMGEFGARALRDTQDSILGQQANVLREGYGQSLSAAQNDASRQAQLASTVGGLSRDQQQAILSGGQMLSNSLDNANQMRLSGANQFGQLGQTLGSLTQAQQSQLANIGSQLGNFANSDYQGRLSGLNSLMDATGRGQQMQYNDINQLNQYGLQQQQQNQRQLDSAYQQYQLAQQYPQQQAAFASQQLQGLSGLVPTTQTTSQTNSGNTGLSPLSQFASLGSLAGGLFGDGGPFAGGGNRSGNGSNGFSFGDIASGISKYGGGALDYIRGLFNR